MKVALITAIDEQGGIGYKGDLPWPRIPDDMKHFREVTDGGVVIMGRKTWDSIPEKFRPLPGRLNFILSRDPKYHTFGMVEPNKGNFTATLDAAIEQAKLHAESYNRDIFIIGGASLYEEALERDLVDCMYLTRVHGTYKADTVFPNFAANEWKSTDSRAIEAKGKSPALTFYTYVKRTSD